MINDIKRIVSFTLILFVWPLLVYSHQHFSENSGTLIFQTRIMPYQFIEKNADPNICHLTIEKSANDKFEVTRAEVDYGKKSHFFKAENSDYVIEIWQNNERIFSGGFNNPNIIRHELMDETGKWERNEILQNETTMAVRVPLEEKHKSMTIKIYRTETKL